MSSRKRRLNLQRHGNKEQHSPEIWGYRDNERKLESSVSQVRVMITDTTSMRVS